VIPTFLVRFPIIEIYYKSAGYMNYVPVGELSENAMKKWSETQKCKLSRLK